MVFVGLLEWREFLLNALQIEFCRYCKQKYLFQTRSAGFNSSCL